MAVEELNVEHRPRELTDEHRQRIAEVAAYNEQHTFSADRVAALLRESPKGSKQQPKQGKGRPKG